MYVLFFLQDNVGVLVHRQLFLKIVDLILDFFNLVWAYLIGQDLSSFKVGLQFLGVFNFIFNLILIFIDDLSDLVEKLGDVLHN